MVFPRLNVHGDVSFLVDTGADASLLSPTDAINMGVDFSRIPLIGRATGVGGASLAYTERAVIIFSEPGTAIWAYRVDLDILAPGTADYLTPANTDPEEQLHRLPSLLGREILDRWHMNYDPYNATLQFEVHSADVVIDRSNPQST